MNKVLAFVQSHWVAIITFGAAFWAEFGGPILDWVHNHPHYAVAFNLVSFVTAYYLRSPINRNGVAPAAIGFPKP